MKPRTHYSVLGIPDGSSIKDVKLAYRKLAKETHPDVIRDNQPDHQSVEFHEINEAARVLSSPLLKASYDLSLSSTMKNGKIIMYSNADSTSNAVPLKSDNLGGMYTTINTIKDESRRSNAFFYRDCNPRPKNEIERLGRAKMRVQNPVKGSSIVSTLALNGIIIGALGIGMLSV